VNLAAPEIKRRPTRLGKIRDATIARKLGK
jgi:hypothetical protein